MNKHILDKFFDPQAIAIVGASPREGSIGHYLIRNLQADNFPGDYLSH